LSRIEVTEKDGALRFAVHVKPRARRSAILEPRSDEDTLPLALAAPPVDGAANDELVRFLAERLNLPRRNVEIVRGETSRMKLVAVRGLDRGTLLHRLSLAPKPEK
jgi:uncharacterized protein (TIGR00251 family)